MTIKMILHTVLEKALGLEKRWKGGKQGNTNKRRRVDAGVQQLNWGEFNVGNVLDYICMDVVGQYTKPCIKGKLERAALNLGDIGMAIPETGEGNVLPSWGYIFKRSYIHTRMYNPETERLWIHCKGDYLRL